MDKLTSISKVFFILFFAFDMISSSTIYTDSSSKLLTFRIENDYEHIIF